MRRRYARVGPLISTVPKTTELARLLLPLAAANIFVDLTELLLTGGISRAASAGAAGDEAIRDALGAYVLSIYLMSLVGSAQLQATSVALVFGRASRRRVLLTVAAVGLGCGLLLLALSSDLLGTFVFCHVQRAPPHVALLARTSLSRLCVWPMLDGIARCLAGLLVSGGHSAYASVGSVTDNCVQLAAIALFGYRLTPLSLCIAVLYAGVLARLVALGLLYMYFAADFHVRPASSPHQPFPPALHHNAPADASSEPCSSRVSRDHADADADEKGHTASFRAILHFWWPLALVQFCQVCSRPLLSVFVARDSDEPTTALATLAVCYPTAHILCEYFLGSEPAPLAAAC